MPMSNKKPALEKDDDDILAWHFNLELYNASFPIKDLKRFALTCNKEEKRSIPNWIEACFKGFDWFYKVKHNTEYDRLHKKSPAEFMEWLDKQSEEGKTRLKCGICKDLKDDALTMTWIEGVDMEAWQE